MTTVRDGLLPMLDNVRGLAGKLGFRLYTVTLRTRTWTGPMIGEGTKTDVDTVLKTATGENVGVELVNMRDIFTSGGKYMMGDVKIGPITPRYTGGGYDPSDVNPSSTLQEVFWKVDGPGFVSGGTWCDRVGEEVKALRHKVILRPSGRTP